MVASSPGHGLVSAEGLSRFHLRPHSPGCLSGDQFAHLSEHLVVVRDHRGDRQAVCGACAGAPAVRVVHARSLHTTGQHDERREECGACAEEPRGSASVRRVSSEPACHSLPAVAQVAARGDGRVDHLGGDVARHVDVEVLRASDDVARPELPPVSALPSFPLTTAAMLYWLVDRSIRYSEWPG